MQIKRTIGEVLFDLLNNVIMFLVLIACLYPLWYVTIASFSDVDAVAMGKVILLPKGMNFSAYEQVFNTKNIWTSYGNTIFYSIAGTLLSMFLSQQGHTHCPKSIWWDISFLPGLYCFQCGSVQDLCLHT